MSQLQTIKTAIHEIAHAKLHAIDPTDPEQTNRPDSRTREVQAESVAYAVCQHYGLDTSEYSFGYVAGWSSGRELAELKASLEIIRNTAHELISALDEHLAELRQQRERIFPLHRRLHLRWTTAIRCSSRPAIPAMTTPCMARIIRLWTAANWTHPV